MSMSSEELSFVPAAPEAPPVDAPESLSPVILAVAAKASAVMRPEKQEAKECKENLEAQAQELEKQLNEGKLSMEQYETELKRRKEDAYKQQESMRKKYQELAKTINDLEKELERRNTEIGGIDEQIKVVGSKLTLGNDILSSSPPLPEDRRKKMEERIKTLEEQMEKLRGMKETLTKTLDDLTLERENLYKGAVVKLEKPYLDRGDEVTKFDAVEAYKHFLQLARIEFAFWQAKIAQAQTKKMKAAASSSAAAPSHKPLVSVEVLSDKQLSLLKSVNFYFEADGRYNPFLMDDLKDALYSMGKMKNYGSKEDISDSTVQQALISLITQGQLRWEEVCKAVGFDILKSRKELSEQPFNRGGDMSCKLEHFKVGMDGKENAEILQVLKGSLFGNHDLSDNGFHGKLLEAVKCGMVTARGINEVIRLRLGLRDYDIQVIIKQVNERKREAEKKAAAERAKESASKADSAKPVEEAVQELRGKLILTQQALELEKKKVKEVQQAAAAQAPSSGGVTLAAAKNLWKKR